MAAKAKQRTNHPTRDSGGSNKELIAKPTTPDVPRAAYTIKEFCAAHRISEAMYYKLRDAGLGPREMRALRKVTISVEAAAEWRRERENATTATSDGGQS